MSDKLLPRVNTIAADLLTGERVEVTEHGEDYYTVAVLAADGRKSNFPPVWLSPSASDQQIKDKLALAVARNLNPDSAPDDLSVPNLQTEGSVRP